MIFMTKYDGMRKLDTSVSESGAVGKRRGRHGDFWLRTAFAVIIIAVPMLLKLVPKAEKAVSAVKSAITYDLVEREEKDGTKFTFVELIKEYSASENGDRE